MSTIRSSWRSFNNHSTTNTINHTNLLVNNNNNNHKQRRLRVNGAQIYHNILNHTKHTHARHTANNTLHDLTQSFTKIRLQQQNTHSIDQLFDDAILHDELYGNDDADDLQHNNNTTKLVKKSGTDTKLADISDVTVVRDRATAEHVLSKLYSIGVKSRFHAIDTEVTNIDVKTQSPVGNGEVTCISIYVGPDIDFGNGPRLFIDTLDCIDCNMFDIFRPYLQDVTIKKVWHNYSFDRAVLYNHNINVLGFGGDTMHMARLWDSARKASGGYSLEDLSHTLLGSQYVKRGLKQRFSRANLKLDGTPGATFYLPPIHEIQRADDFKVNWIDYATFDTKATYLIREQLELNLRRIPWSTTNNNNSKNTSETMYDFYQRYYLPFGELLTDMERIGFYIRQDNYLPTVQKQAESDREQAVQQFLSWGKQQFDVVKYMNIHSAAQKQQLFYGAKGSTREFKTENIDNIILDGKTKPSKYYKFHLPGLGIPVQNKTKKGSAAVDLATLYKLCGSKLDSDTPKYGTVYEHFGGGEQGKQACLAINALCRVSAVGIMINTFIIPLQQSVDSHHRIHCSLNLNTETGRLSSRRPNLQNQPALEKDVYKVRDAFAAEPGNKLIVADYGQLELRVLAHMTKCQSMIHAFKLGGDFHSRTALGMYDYINDAIKNNQCVLEWNERDNGPSSVPLLKDMYKAERQRAKILNFSIAYGKTARGLANDFGVMESEAEKIVNLWYRDRPEVKQWQDYTIQHAKKFEYTRTLMGRYRPLYDINSKSVSVRSHMMRAAINTPIQGGAADIVMMAMLKLHSNKRLKQLKWKIILQIHDEIICEGPEESTDEAMVIVKQCMESPFRQPLLVDLSVDAKADYTWYRAK